MTRPDDDEMLRRLRAADPAAEVPTDLDRVRAAVHARLGAAEGEPVRTVVPPGGAAEAVPGAVSPTVVPMRRRRSWVGWAAAAAAVVVVVVGGGYVASGVLDRAADDGAAAPAPAVTSGADPAPEDSAGAPGGREAEAAPARPGPVRHVAVGLSDEGSTGTVHQVSPASVDRAQVERYAQAWQVPGTVRADGADAWTVGDGTRTLRVSQADGLVHVELDDTAAGRASADVAAAREVLTDAGVDLTDMTATTSGGVVSLRQTVAGQPTTLGWQVETGASGPRRIVGTLGGEVTTLGQYALVSPAAAVARLDSTVFRGWSATMPDGDATLTGAVDEADGSLPLPAASSPAAPTAGVPLPWPVTTVEITGARLGLALDTSSGTALLVPAYALTSAQSTVLVPALADDALAEE